MVPPHLIRWGGRCACAAVFGAKHIAQEHRVVDQPLQQLALNHFHRVHASDVADALDGLDVDLNGPGLVGAVGEGLHVELLLRFG